MEFCDISIKKINNFAPIYSFKISIGKQVGEGHSEHSSTALIGTRTEQAVSSKSLTIKL